VIIIGHPLIPYKPFYRVTKIEEIKQTAPNSIVLVDFSDKELVQCIKDQDVPLALKVDSLKDACIANAFGAEYIIVKQSLSKGVQRVATEYLFDAKVLIEIEDENLIEIVAKDLIDGVVFKQSII
jgi:hypothetical protein